ncbi:MAG: hypothetical protein R3F61_16365 [Myxococcota bacterium]
MTNWLLLNALTACSTHRNHLEVATDGLPADHLAVSAPLFLADHDEGDPFRRNTVVGNLTFTGGFVTENTGAGLFNVSKEVSLASEDLYRTQVSDWLADTLGPPTVVLDPPPPPPVRRDERGTRRHDGHDNVSLPRMELRPQAGGTFTEPTLVPWVVTYVTHNGGWFFGQEYGTGGGARIRVLLVAYDANGQVLGYRDVDASRISERVFSPTGPQMQDFLITLEEKVARKIR